MARELGPKRTEEPRQAIKYCVPLFILWERMILCGLTTPTVEVEMPEISRFLGIIIFMNWGDHPLPHFHAKYGAYEISVEIETGIVKGHFPKRALRAVLDWLDEHQAELLLDWQLAEQHKPLNPIAPLE